MPDDVKELRQSLKFDNITSARIVLAHAGISILPDYVFDLNNTRHTKKLKEIIKHLKLDKYRGYAEEKILRKGGDPTFLIIEFEDGTTINIKAAAGEKFTTLADKTLQMEQYDIPKEITITVNSEIEPFRLESNEIRKLIDGGYKKFFN